LWFYVAAFIVKLLLDSNFEKAYLLEWGSYNNKRDQLSYLSLFMAFIINAMNKLPLFLIVFS
jgi:hypothetical protein